MNKNNCNKLFFLVLCALSVASGCKKNNYFIDTGTHNADYNGTVFEYLQNHPHHQFDSLCKVIRLAGMENTFQKEPITFFAPADTTIKKSVRLLNIELNLIGKDTISDLRQLSPEFWKKQLSLYLFKGERRLKDFPQLDPARLQTFPGQYYESYGGKIMLIGTVFYSAGGVEYAGYRQLTLGYFTGNVPPTGVLLSFANAVASSDIHPVNGIVHALQWSNARIGEGSGTFVINTEYFGFNPFDFITDAKQIGLQL